MASLPINMFKNIDAVLFDLDGTLIDSAPDLGAAADKMRTDRGLVSLPLADYRPMAGAGARGMIGVAFGLTPQDAEFEALKQEFFANYQACMTERTYAFDGVAEVIAQISQAGFSGFATGLVNFADEFPYIQAELLPRLERLGLRHPLRDA